MPEGLEIEFNEENRRIGILIAVMAAGLAVSEAATHSAQTDMLKDTIQASDTWAFYQAKNIRGTILRTDAKHLELQSADLPAGPQRDSVAKAIADMRATTDRYESEPSTGEGKKELMAKARALEAHRDERQGASEKYELGSAALQLGILLASSAVVTGLRWLAILGGSLGALGIALALTGWLAPGLLG
jgi:hypothetical protein